MQILLYIVFGSFIGAGLIYLILSPKLKTIQKLNENIALENNKLEECNNNLKVSKVFLDNEIAQLIDKKNDIVEEIGRVNNTLVSTREKAESAAGDI